MKGIRIGAIGVGDVSQGAHLPGIEASPDLTLWAICDIDAGKLAAVGERYGVPEERRFLEHGRLLACPGVDAVDIATPNDCHVHIAMDAVAAGKPLSVEKPVGLCAREVGALADAARERGLPSMVCFSYRFRAAARFARYLVASGELGDVYHVNMQYFQAWGNPIWGTPLIWRFQRARAGSGALGDLGSHGLDLVRFVTGQEYAEVVGQTSTIVTHRARLDGTGSGPVDVDDITHALARMTGGASASFQISRVAYGRGNYQRMEVYGSRGALVYTLGLEGDDDTIDVCMGEGMRQTNAFARLPVPAWYRASQMQAFADIVGGHGDERTATLWDGWQNQRALDAVLASVDERAWVALEAEGDRA